MSQIETELKFQVPAADLPKLRAALAAYGLAQVRLRAAYADTADLRLAAAGLALRLRQEDERWVQTLKGRGDGLMARPEHEVALPPSTRRPRIDPTRHAGTPAGDALLALLADGTPLVERYRTEVQRSLRRVKSGGATIEIALDEGRIVAGRRQVPVCEVEFELIAGPVGALFALAARWAARHGLWLDVRTKSERGHRLAQELVAVPAVKAARMAARVDTPALAFAAMLRNALGQLMPNAAEMAAGTGTPEHLHQLRVALRRLRTALRLFSAWCADPQAARSLELRWREPFSRLGSARDADVLAALPGLTLPPLPAGEDPAAVVREAAFSVLVLETLALAESAHPALEAPLVQATHEALAQAWRSADSGARRFASDEPAARHRTRRRLKRLRYATEFLRPLLPAKETDRALAAIGAALDALGEYNDNVVADARCRGLDTQDPKVAFALGWLAAQREYLLQRCVRRLARLRPHRQFWR